MDRKTDRWAGGKVMWTNRYAKVRLMGGWLEGGRDRQIDRWKRQR